MRKFTKVMLLASLCLLTGISQAQVISNVPSNNPNNRFTEEIMLGMERPGLSVIGFDNGGDNQHGYGLKQILNQAWKTTSNDQKEIVKNILNSAYNDVNPPNGDGDIEDNSKYLQYKAFEALASYVLEHNGIDSSTSNSTYNIPIRTHSIALNDFTQSIMSVVTSLTGKKHDYVKDVRSFANIARAIDLYLALENAYKEWNYSEWNNPNSTILLSEQEKNSLMNNFYSDIYDYYYNRLNRNVAPFGVQEDEVEPGNRPLKGHLAVGYSAMGIQVESTDGPNPITADLLMLHNEAETRASPLSSDNENRYNLWSYQTEAGQRFWAEGPYYLSYVLPDAIQFWHAMRAAQSNMSDPFENPSFLNPIEWLADVSTPDGVAPPIDDGNKFIIKAANLLRWSDDYGNTEIGKKYNDVYQNYVQYHSANNFGNHRYLLELAIPRRSSSSVKNINYDTQQPGSAQQLIGRHTDGSGSMHYVYLNTESGNAIKRGEGHEQPDQLQLLYYIDEHSYLVDSGYDEGLPEENSFRNGYLYHNTMHYSATAYSEDAGYVTYQNYGGLESPYLSFGKARKVSDHHPVNYKQFLQPSGKVKLLKAGVDIYFEKKADHTATYDRKVIFIEDQNPYIIDLNRIKANSSKKNFVMKYHGNGSQSSTNNGWTQWSNSIDGASKKLFNYTVTLDNNFNESLFSLDILEYENKSGGVKTEYPIKVKSLKNEGDDSFATIGFLKVSSVTPTYQVQSASLSNYSRYALLKQDANTVDVVVFRNNNFNIEEDFNITGNVSIPHLRIPAGSDFGYARLHNINGEWSIDPDYQINLERASVEVAISGPQFLSSGQVGTWSANVSNEKGPISYQWYRRESLNGSWTSVGVTNSSYSTYFSNLGSTEKQAGVRVDVTSAGESATAAKIVHVSPADNCGSYSTADGDTLQSYNSTGPNSLEGDTVNSDSVGTNIIIPCSSSTTQTQAKQQMQDQLIVSKPESFTVDPNYPNPFNPSTTIKYGLPEQSEVTVNIYNILGQNVATLVNETQTAGRYTARFDASRLASGLYIARIIAQGVSGEQFVRELKMQLVK